MGIDRANAAPYGLAASVWTENTRRGHDRPTRLDFGTVWVNAHLVLANEAPWAGSKARDTAATYPSTPSTTTPAPNTSCTTTTADHDPTVWVIVTG